MHANNRVFASGFSKFSICLAFALILSGCVVGAGIGIPHSSTASKAPISKTTLTGFKQHVSKYAEVNADCTSAGVPIIRVIEAPTHGVASSEPDQDYTDFPSTNQRYECNKIKLPVAAVFYTSEPDFKGSDSFSIEVIFPNGNAKKQQFLMTVE